MSAATNPGVFPARDGFVMHRHAIGGNAGCEPGMADFAIGIVQLGNTLAIGLEASSSEPGLAEMLLLRIVADEVDVAAR